MAKRDDDFMPTDSGIGDRRGSEGNDIILDGADDVRGIAADEEDEDEFDEDEDLEDAEDEDEEEGQ